MMYQIYLIIKAAYCNILTNCLTIITIIIIIIVIKVITLTTIFTKFNLTLTIVFITITVTAWYIHRLFYFTPGEHRSLLVKSLNLALSILFLDQSLKITPSSISKFDKSRFGLAIITIPLNAKFYYYHLTGYNRFYLLERSVTDQLVVYIN